MAALRKYPDELRQRAIRLVREAEAEPDTSRKAACRRVGQQLGISPDTLRGWVTRDEIDTLLGAVLEYADGSFNTILELGFASSIRKEWEWRISRGEPIRNLEAFRGPLSLDELGSPAEE